MGNTESIAKDSTEEQPATTTMDGASGGSGARRREEGRGMRMTLAGQVHGDEGSGKSALLHRLRGEDPFSSSTRQQHDNSKKKRMMALVSYRCPPCLCVDVAAGEEALVAQLHIVECHGHTLDDKKAADFIIVLIDPRLNSSLQFAHSLLKQLQTQQQQTQQQQQQQTATTAAVCVCILLNFRDLVSPAEQFPVTMQRVLDMTSSFSFHISILESSMKNCYGLIPLHNSFISIPYLHKRRHNLQMQLNRIESTISRQSSQQPNTVLSYEHYLQLPNTNNDNKPPNKTVHKPDYSLTTTTTTATAPSIPTTITATKQEPQRVNHVEQQKERRRQFNRAVIDQRQQENNDANSSAAALPPIVEAVKENSRRKVISKNERQVPAGTVAGSGQDRKKALEAFLALDDDDDEEDSAALTLSFKRKSDFRNSLVLYSDESSSDEKENEKKQQRQGRTIKKHVSVSVKNNASPLTTTTTRQQSLKFADPTITTTTFPELVENVNDDVAPVVNSLNKRTLLAAQEELSRLDLPAFVQLPEADNGNNDSNHKEEESAKSDRKQTHALETDCNGSHHHHYCLDDDADENDNNPLPLDNNDDNSNEITNAHRFELSENDESSTESGPLLLSSNGNKMRDHQIKNEAKIDDGFYNGQKMPTKKIHIQQQSLHNDEEENDDDVEDDGHLSEAKPTLAPSAEGITTSVGTRRSMDGVFSGLNQAKFYSDDEDDDEDAIVAGSTTAAAVPLADSDSSNDSLNGITSATKNRLSIQSLRRLSSSPVPPIMTTNNNNSLNESTNSVVSKNELTVGGGVSQAVLAAIAVAQREAELMLHPETTTEQDQGSSWGEKKSRSDMSKEETKKKKKKKASNEEKTKKKKKKKSSNGVENASDEEKKVSTKRKKHKEI